MSENIDVLLAELRKKNIAKKRRKLLDPEPVTPAIRQKKAVRRNEAVYLRAARRIRGLDYNGRRSKGGFNEEEFIEVAKRIDGKK